MTVRIGAEILLSNSRAYLRGERVGLVVHPASVLPNLRHTVDAFMNEDYLRPVALFGPQHGARGEKQDNMIESDHYRDPETGLPVHSLYSETRRPTERMLSDLDVLVFDLQDVGTRIYTFVYTMSYCMEACAEYGKRMIILDRPNPINGRHVEGNLLEPEFKSFVGRYPMPMRHGMTVGELARFFNAEFKIECDLSVVPMEGWKRSDWFDQTGLPWVQPSPNIPTLDSAVVYPGTVLVEGTRLSEGRGTTRPFELVGAPYIRPRDLAARLNSQELPGVQFRAAYFEPTSQKWSGQTCGGVQIHVQNREVFEPYLTGIAILSAIQALYPESFKWREPPYEYEYDKRPIDMLSGSGKIPAQIESGVSPAEIRFGWQSDVARFLRQREPYLLYS
jgi:uncharacterized protein YbbC (DUF1343 family)